MAHKQTMSLLRLPFEVYEISWRRIFFHCLKEKCKSVNQYWTFENGKSRNLREWSSNICLRHNDGHVCLCILIIATGHLPKFAKKCEGLAILLLANRRGSIQSVIFIYRMVMLILNLCLKFNVKMMIHAFGNSLTLP